MKFEQVTSCIWSASVENKDIQRDGWEKYRIVQRGKYFSLNMTMNLGGMLKMHEIASGVPTLSEAIQIAENFDAEHYDPMTSVVFVFGAIIGIGLLAYVILSWSN